MGRYAATVFDLDNTLCRHEQDIEAVFYGAFEDVGSEPVGNPADLWAAMEPITAYDTAADQLADGIRRVAAERGRDIDIETWTAAFRARLDWTDVSLLPGAKAALAAARENGPVGLLTNGPEQRQSTKLAALGIEDAFDIVVFAGDLNRRKPAREPFERVLGALDTPAEATLYVGDSLAYDVAGARRAGLPVAWIEDGDPGEYTPDHTLSCIGELESVYE